METLETRLSTAMRDPNLFAFFSQEKGPENEPRLYILWLLARVPMLFNITCVAPRSGRQNQQQPQRHLPPIFFYWIQIISLDFILLSKTFFIVAHLKTKTTRRFFGERYFPLQFCSFHLK